MERHRVRIAKCIDGTGIDHKFVEIWPDKWLEVDAQKPITHDAIHKYIRFDEQSNEHDICHATRAFQIGLVRDWREEEPVVSE